MCLQCDTIKSGYFQVTMTLTTLLLALSVEMMSSYFYFAFRKTP